MPTWRNDDGLDDMPPRTLEVFADIDVALDAVPGEPLIIRSMSIETGSSRPFDCAVEVELAPGAILLVTYASVDVQAGSSVYASRRDVARHVSGVVTDVCRRGREDVADMLHDLRVRLRRTLAEWTAEGAPASLHDVRLIRSEDSDPADPFETQVRLEVVDDALRPALESIFAGHPKQIDAELRHAEARLKRLFAIRSALARRGATGSVDRLVLNALAMEARDVPAALRRASRTTSVTKHGDTELFIEEGRMRCRGRGGGLTWDRGRIRLKGLVVPGPVRVAAVGRPVTDLIEHPVLSGDMVVTEVVVCEDDFDKFTDVGFDQEVSLYDGVTGRSWPNE